MVGNGVADARVGHGLDVGVQEADLPGAQLVARDGLGRLVAEPLHFKHLAVRPQTDLLALAQAAVQDARQNDHAAVGIEPGIEDQRAQGGIRVALWRRDQVHDGLEHVVDAGALLGAHQQRVARVEPDNLLDLLANALGLRGGQIDFVDYGDDFQVVVQRQVGIGERLRLHALGGVHHQQRALAGLQAARNLIGEIHVAGRIDEVELVGVAVARPCS